jgi:WD40 repeat protein
MKTWETNDGPIVSVAFSPDGRRLAAAGKRALHAWDVAGGRPPAVVSHEFPYQVAFAPDGLSVLTHDEYDLLSWDAGGGQLRKLAQATGGVCAFALDPAGRVAVYSSVEYLCNDLQWYSFDKGGWVDEWAGLGPSGGFVLCFSPDGRRLALPSNSRLVLYDVASRSNLADVEIPEGPRVLLAYSSDGSRIVCGAGRRLVVFDADTLRGRVELANCPAVVAELRSGRAYFSGVAFHPSGRSLAATGHDGAVRLYDAATWKEAQAYDWGVGKLLCVAFSPDGALGAAGGEGGQVVVWDVEC